MCSLHEYHESNHEHNHNHEQSRNIKLKGSINTTNKYTMAHIPLIHQLMSVYTNEPSHIHKLKYTKMHMYTNVPDA